MGNVICHDWEFYEDGKTIEPISVGFVSASGDEYYAIFENAEYTAQKSEWLYENVFPHIYKDLVHNPLLIKPKQTIAEEVRQFICSFPEPELWAWYGAYDHVLMAQTLGGKMIDLPNGIPMFTNDIKTLELIAGGDVLPGAQSLDTQHHALYDAKHDMELYRCFKGNM